MIFVLVWISREKRGRRPRYIRDGVNDIFNATVMDYIMSIVTH